MKGKIDYQFQKITKKFQNSDKRKPAKVLAGFLIIMFILGMISRGIYAYMLPRVNVTSPSRGTITHTVTGEGMVEANDTMAVNVLPDLLVADIYVEKGSSVSMGDPLLQLDLNDLNDCLNEKADKIAILQMEIEDLQSSATHSSQVYGLTAERAEEDYAITVSQAQLELDQANTALEEAMQVSTNRISRDQYIREKIASDGSVIAAQQAVHELESDGVKDGHYDDAVEYMDMMVYLARQSAEDAYDAETIKIAQDIEAANALVEEKELKLQEAILGAEREIEDASLAPVSDHSAAIKQIELDDLLEEQAIYEEILSQNGVVTAPTSGIVSQIGVSEGSKTPTEAAFFIALSEGTYSIKVPIGENDRKYVAIGNEVHINFPGSGSKTDSAILDNIVQENGQNYMIITFESSLAQIGEVGAITIESSGVAADVTVPIQALHSDGIRYFVYVTEHNSTILGEEITVSMRVVSIGEKNDRTVELINSGLSTDSEVIIASDKEISDGATVRMAEK